MERYHVGECNCQLKKIRIKEDNAEYVEYIFDKANIVCPNCKTSYTYKGLIQLDGDLKRGEEEGQYIEFQKEKRKEKTLKDYIEKYWIMLDYQ